MIESRAMCKFLPSCDHPVHAILYPWFPHVLHASWGRLEREGVALSSGLGTERTGKATQGALMTLISEHLSPALRGDYIS